MSTEIWEPTDRLREAIAGALHEARGLLAGDVLVYEDCLLLADAVLELGEVRDVWELNNGGLRIPLRRAEALAHPARDRITQCAMLTVPLSATPKDGTEGEAR